MARVDSIGQEINIGDMVAYSRTGRKLNMHKGKVVSFTPKGFQVKSAGCGWTDDGYYEHPHTVRTEGIVKIFKQD